MFTATKPPVPPPSCSCSPRIGIADAAQVRADDVIERLTALETSGAALNDGFDGAKWPSVFDAIDSPAQRTTSSLIEIDAPIGESTFAALSHFPREIRGSMDAGVVSGTARLGSATYRLRRLVGHRG